MKRIIFNVISIIAVLLVVVSCEKNPIEKANEDYDYSKVIPELTGISGPSATAASGLEAVTYSVQGRGGSTFTWAIVDWTGTIVNDDENYSADITFDQSSVDATCYVTCFETTAGGINSEMDTIEVSLGAFCPMDLADFAGTWVGSETGDSEVDPLTVTITVEGDQLKVATLGGGTPGFLSAVFLGWGETFQDGFGNEGEIYLDVNLLSGSVSVPKVYWGQTLPGPYDYWQTGDGGTWAACGDFTMTIHYGLDWSGDGGVNRESDLVLVKQ
jgi:hypothetical protein